MHRQRDTYFEAKDRRIATLEARLSHWRTLEGLARREAEGLRRSWSYRVGRLLVAPLSLVKRRLLPGLLAGTAAPAAAPALPPLARHPRFSLLMPVRDPRPADLEAALDSVAAQRYPNWQLCIADDGSRDPRVVGLITRFARRHARRVRRVRLDAPQGIAAASNAAAALATGEFLGLLDHDDLLADEALWRVAAAFLGDARVGVVYTDEDKLDRRGRRVQPFHKPGFSPALLESCNYLCHFTALRRDLFERIGGFAEGVDGSQDHDLALRASEAASRVVHLPQVLYHWRMAPGSAAGDPAAKGGPWRESAREALRRRLARCEVGGSVDNGLLPGTYRVRRKVDPALRVGIVVPTRDRLDLLRPCLDTLYRTASARIGSIVVVSNGSREEATLRFLLQERSAGRLRFLIDDGPFNFARLCNRAAQQLDEPYLLFLNNDVEALDDGWLEALLEQAVAPGVGAVGAKLVYPDGRLQHAGIVTGLMGIAGHPHRGADPRDSGYFGWIDQVRDCSAVTGACLLTRRDLFEDLGGFDERLAVAFNDVDYGLRVREAGRRVVYTPHARLRHHESASRGPDAEGPGASRFESEVLTMVERWGERLSGDPFYSPARTPWREDFGLPQPADATRRSAFYSRFAIPADSPRRESPRRAYAEVWDALSAGWEDAVAHVSGSERARDFENSALETLAQLEATVGIGAEDRVLEIGCGVGRVGLPLSERCFEWVGCDVSPNMLRHARRRLAGRPNVSLLEVSGFDLQPLEAAAFDLAYCTVVFMHLEETERWAYVQEAHRVLRRGGRLYLDNLTLSTDEGWEVFRRHAAMPAEERPAHFSRPSSAEELTAYVGHGGFHDVRCRTRGPFVQCWAVK